jgi:1-acyl-sn-glycerol-3-phosphate acyltransferase
MPDPLPGPVRGRFRYPIVRGFCWLVVRVLFRLRVEGRAGLPPGPAIYCFNHLNWADPIVLMAAMPWSPPLALFGPKEEDMGVGARNRLISWAGTAVPYRPGKNDLLDTTRRVQRALDAGWALAIAGEGTIHRWERELLPLADGTAYFALRARVPIVPVAINGTSWLGFRRRLRVRFGTPLAAEGRPSSETVRALTTRLEAALLALVADHPDPPPPGPFGRWLTELFNDWPGGTRPERRPGDIATADAPRRDGARPD